MAASVADLQTYARAAARRYGVPEEMFVWQIGKESNWDVNAKNPNSSASGIAQFIDGTANWLGVDRSDPYASLDAAAKYDAMLYSQTGDWGQALTQYGTLHGADQKTIQQFNQALGGAVAEPTMLERFKAGFKNLTDYTGVMGASNLFKDSINKGAEATGVDTGGWDPIKIITGNIGFIVLGIVVISLAVLSNNTVRSAATKAVLKK